MAFGTGGAGTAIGNFQTGFNAPAEYRSFFNFDLSSVSGPVTAATFSISLVGNFGSGKPRTPTEGLAPVTIETVTIFDVTSEFSALTGNTGGAPAFADPAGECRAPERQAGASLSLARLAGLCRSR